MARPRTGDRRSWRRHHVHLVLGVMASLAILIPVRVVAFPDDHPLTIVLLGPATEEALKLAGTFVVLATMAVVVPPSGDGARQLQRRLFLAPWIVGGLYGAYEGLALYRTESGFFLVVRVWIHAATVALAVAVCLWLWREGAATARGAWGGYLVALAAHDAFNALSLLAALGVTDVTAQGLYAAVLPFVAFAALTRTVPAEPASRTAARFLAPGAGRVRA